MKIDAGTEPNDPYTYLQACMFCYLVLDVDTDQASSSLQDTNSHYVAGLAGRTPYPRAILPVCPTDEKPKEKYTTEP